MVDINLILFGSNGTATQLFLWEFWKLSAVRFPATSLGGPIIGLEFLTSTLKLIVESRRQATLIPIVPVDSVIHPSNILQDVRPSCQVRFRPLLRGFSSPIALPGLAIADLIRFNQSVLIDTTPLPDSIPSVPEVGASSAPLLSASFFIGARCRQYNDDFMQCKTENAGKAELDCLKEGRRVTRCASSV